MATFNVVLDKRRMLKGNLYPIKIRVTHDRKTKVVTTGYRVQATHFNKNSQRVSQRNPNAKKINLAIQKQLNSLQEKALELELAGESIIEGLFSDKKKSSEITTLSFIQEIITDLESQQRYGNALVYNDLKRSFEQFLGKDKLITKVDYGLIRKYESYLKQRGLKTNSIAVYLRTLRAVINRAIKLGYIKKDDYPFEGLKISQERTRKRAIGEKEIGELEEQLRHSHLCCPKSFALRIFLLSFRTRGMSFIDLAHLKKSDVSNGRIYYRRQKTHQLIDVLVTPKVNELLQTFENSHSERLLPLFNERAEHDVGYRKNYLKSVLKRINKQLKKVGEELDLNQPLTTYVARHSFATIARKKGYSIELIAQAMGHAHGNNVTQIYLEPFDQEIVDQMHLAVCG